MCIQNSFDSSYDPFDFCQAFLKSYWMHQGLSGSPILYINIMRSDAYLLDKHFLANTIKSRININPTTNCWEWSNGSENVYGVIKIQKKCYSIHRISAYVWLNLNLDSKKKLACHKCNRRFCCNPSHLFIGTHHDNTQDYVNKGRHPFNRICGSKRPKAKLHETDIPIIRHFLKNGMLAIDIAKSFNVSFSTIQSIKHNRTWTHVPINIPVLDFNSHCFVSPKTR